MRTVQSTRTLDVIGIVASLVGAFGVIAWPTGASNGSVAWVVIGLVATVVGLVGLLFSMLASPAAESDEPPVSGLNTTSIKTSAIRTR